MCQRSWEDRILVVGGTCASLNSCHIILTLDRWDTLSTLPTQSKLTSHERIYSPEGVVLSLLSLLNPDLWFIFHKKSWYPLLMIPRLKSLIAEHICCALIWTTQSSPEAPKKGIYLPSSLLGDVFPLCPMHHWLLSLNHWHDHHKPSSPHSRLAWQTLILCDALLLEHPLCLHIGGNVLLLSCRAGGYINIRGEGIRRLQVRCGAGLWFYWLAIGIIDVDLSHDDAKFLSVWPSPQGVSDPLHRQLWWYSTSDSHLSHKMTVTLITAPA